MDPEAFAGDILNPLEAHVSGFDGQRVWIAYQDATNVADVIARFEGEIGDRELSDWNDLGKHAEATQVYFLENYIGTLYKALIEFANIFMAVLLHELDQRPDHGPTVRTLCESPTALSLDRAMLQAAYCLYIYRNKIVVHHDVPRCFATKRNRLDGRRWLKPLLHMVAPEARITDDDWRDVVILQRRYSRLSSDPDLAVEANPFAVVDGLFYLVPGPYGSKVSADRALINRIAERVGCQSMTVPEVVATIDAFAREMVRSAQCG